MAEPIKKVVVDEQKWLHGETSEDSFLLRASDRKMCCLGFACVQGGVEEGDLEQVEMPYMVSPRPADKVPGNLLGRWVDLASRLNDTPNGREPLGWEMTKPVELVKDDEDRKKQLIKLFAEQGIELEFVNGTDSVVQGKADDDREGRVGGVCERDGRGLQGDGEGV